VAWGSSAFGQYAWQALKASNRAKHEPFEMTAKADGRTLHMKLRNRVDQRMRKQ
jgi:hypothetical protein